ncbi:MAG: glgC 2 [Firmicutes bacterium]|nr:glgC 2 [Bacillota bacterium]
MTKTHCVAMLLAGGQGSRLGVLTKSLAKPAVHFGGKYRIIDFTLSNCKNSEFDIVGVLTQYRPLELHSYIGIGSHWDMDRRDGGVFVLPPYAGEEGGEWYKGTADAIYQNINFLEMFQPDHVLVLSGDHIYKMDYSLMLEYHNEKKAAATIGVIEVPWEEANRFGIMSTDNSGRIVDFQEKPANPRNNQASMGIYIFDYAVLKDYLQKDANASSTSHDFGKDIIPGMLADQQKLYAYPFQGYWRDVGTVESYWQANMDLLAEHPELDLYDPAWRIYSENLNLPPHYIAEGASIRCSIASEGSQIYGRVDHSVVFPDVHIAAGAQVKDSVLLSHARIGEGAVLDHVIVGPNTYIHAGTVIIEQETNVDGEIPLQKHSGITLIGADMVIAPAQPKSKQK